MEIPASNATRLFCLYGFLVTSLLFSRINADGKIKQVTDPTGNVNLSPFQQWKRAYECLQTKSDSCSSKYTLTEAPWMNVTTADKEDFCKSGGCGEHTNAVLTCVHLVRQDYKLSTRLQCRTSISQSPMDVILVIVP
ncbi:uncharacterized protein LOC111310052 [Durio zibethinus]|uniref:Uncharacterized protein LOC111310052 n=1 Tax=Durio zibethinus TaxID=66656 RepID=A0A6P6AJ72_DURZI|nr:uncharacterized protein LOC111310052 [Durio zibethinus]